MYTAQISRAARPDSKFNLQYTAEIRRKISKDNGETWGKTEVMFSREGSFCRQKIQILSNGRWVFGNWICFNDDTHNGSDITIVQISDDNGISWKYRAAEEESTPILLKRNPADCLPCSEAVQPTISIFLIPMIGEKAGVCLSERNCRITIPVFLPYVYSQVHWLWPIIRYVRMITLT